MPFRSRHVLTAVGLHLLLFVFLVIGVTCTPRREPPPVIEALVITGQNKEGKLKTEPPPPPPVEEPTPEPPKPPEPEPPPPPPPPPEPPKPEPPKPDPEVEKQKKLAEEKVKRELEIKREAEIQRKKAEEERKKQEEETKRLKEEEERLKKEEERKRVEEQKRKLEEEKRRVEEEKRRLEDERKRKLEEERRLKEMMEQSLAQEAEARAEAARIGEVQKTWAQALNEHIRQRWLRPPSLPSGLRCKVRIEILPNGEVVSVKIVQSSGNPAFDTSVENAVYKSSPLPLPVDPKAFVRVLEPTFTPESLDY